MIRTLIFTVVMCLPVFAVAQSNTNQSKFKQLIEELPTPNVYRTASGAPGHQYYQQRADYDMNVEIDDEKQRLYGEESITYFNNSPDPLTYLWVQLDQNIRAKNSDYKKIRTQAINGQGMSFEQMEHMHNDFDGGFKIDWVRDVSGKEMKYTINQTMMRIDLPKALMPGDNITFQIKWWYNINDRAQIGGRSGMEYFPENANYLYTIAQFFPRMAVYNEVEGWQNKPFLGSGEFALTFGNYKVAITAPADHIVGATGVLQNPTNVLTTEQRNRLKKARTAKEPVWIVTPQEAQAAEKEKSSEKKTWIFKAENVRDYGFCSSRKFIWDAQGVKQNDGITVMAMSYYPKEGNPLWERYSTKIIVHTLKTYSKFTFPYPYPVAISVHTDRIGMEYPMISFNGGRPEPDGTYSQGTKYGMLSVIIHEIGHNYFPMIVNSDERQWTWMDEGLNTFLQYLTEQEWERGYPSRRGAAYKITNYMKGDKSNISAIMTNSETVKQLGNNAYGKPAAALNILRETVMGRELFDFAFKEYSNRWMFKHPTPADFFRTMEDASGVDLDWFWRGWFYSTDHVDVSLDHVSWYRINSQNPDVEFPLMAEKTAERENRFISNQRNIKEIKTTAEEADTSISDFYNLVSPFEVTYLDRKDYERYMEMLTPEQKELLKSGYNYYQLDFSNKGGLIMPIILEFTFKDGSKQTERLPAEIWVNNEKEAHKVFFFKKEVTQIVLDPFLETADCDESNNYWPARQVPSRFQLFKEKERNSNRGGRKNLMQRHELSKKLEERQKRD